MDLAAVMDQVAAQLRMIPSLKGRTLAHPPSKITPPMAFVSYPDSITPRTTYTRGSAQMVLPVWVVVGKVSARAARDQLAAYCDDSGPSSVSAVLEAGGYTAFDDLTVTGISFDTVTITATAYLAAAFELEITGPGR